MSLDIIIYIDIPVCTWTVGCEWCDSLPTGVFSSVDISQLTNFIRHEHNDSYNEYC